MDIFQRIAFQALHETARSDQTPLERLGDCIEKETEQAIFAFGGSIPIGINDSVGQQPPTASRDQQKRPSPTNAALSANADPITKPKVKLDANLKTAVPPSASAPITIRWDSHQTNPKLVFPLEPSRKTDLAELVNDCKPATYGFKGEVVHNTEYRDTGKLDRTKFSSDSCPYELGIIDVIAQMLLPSVIGESSGFRGVKAELYKLNIYSGPSGKFKPHVDTPRSEIQFGSLVVCLPCAHEALKGVDMAAYCVLNALQLRVELRPILESIEHDSDDETDDSSVQSEFEGPSLRREVIGTDLHELDIGGDGFGDVPWLESVREVREHDHEKVLWLNKKGWREPAIAILAYGNEPSVNFEYSSLALLFTVPPVGERARMSD
ncbi:hypothetical protein H2199_007349 [Coniosporium tulheliwenetii]|uniref:Uncharacterized protein n=1 Tax=Coniosporium tulheliwenetii TaxID=3383036 RepID=A0ACC2YRX9_9PEZI|nr:hypothetical protein H2199_007349 [Cladosporium sp. JES 115]